MTVLVTGGAGYIGTHTLVELLNENYNVVVIDNLSNSCVEALNRVEKITGKSVTFYQGDVLNKAMLQKIFTDHKIQSVIHFAGLKAVGESVANPLKYYENNVNGTLVLCEVMAEYSVKNLVFSSSATVYGEPASLPMTEDFPTAPRAHMVALNLWLKRFYKIFMFQMQAGISPYYATLTLLVPMKAVL